MTVGDKKNTGFRLVLPERFFKGSKKETISSELSRIIPSPKSQGDIPDFQIHWPGGYIRAQWGTRENRLYSHSIEVYSHQLGKKPAHMYTLHLEGLAVLRGICIDENYNLIKKALLGKDLESRTGNNLGLYPTAFNVSLKRELKRQEIEGLHFLNRIFKLNNSVEEIFESYL